LGEGQVFGARKDQIRVFAAKDHIVQLKVSALMFALEQLDQLFGCPESFVSRIVSGCSGAYFVHRPRMHQRRSGINPDLGR
jgi:hypothetical protein